MSQVVRNIFLSAAALDKQELDDWLVFIDAFCGILQIDAKVYVYGKSTAADYPATEFNNISILAINESDLFSHIDWETEDLAIVSGSAVISRQLFYYFGSIWILATDKPREINTSLFDELMILLAARKTSFGGIAESIQGKQAMHSAPSVVEWRPMCSLLTSMYNGDEYVDDFLENSAALEQYADMEHFIVRPASPGQEHHKVLDYVQTHKNVLYIWLCKDPGLYEVWNFLSRLSTAQYLSNFNIDDRKNPLHISRLVDSLNQRLAASVASTALRVTTIKNMKWEESDSCSTWFEGDDIEQYGAESLLEIRDKKLASCNMPHCMPVWRRSMHVTNGYFDESQFGPSADWEFWLRAGRQKVQFHLIGEALGLHLKTPDSYWRRSKQSSSFDEKIIRQYTDDHGRYRVPVEERPFALEFAESIRARTAGFVLRYLWCLLVNYGAIRLGVHLADSQRKLVVARCEADFGITEGILEKVYARTGADAVESADKVSEVFWHLVDALHLQPKGVVRSSSTVIQNMQGVVDELLLSNSLCELYVFKAYLSRRMENPGAEAYYLHRARRAKGAEFWEALEKIYRAPTTIKKLRDARDF